jgi:hypothetical protein
MSSMCVAWLVVDCVVVVVGYKPLVKSCVFRVPVVTFLQLSSQDPLD